MKKKKPLNKEIKPELIADETAEQKSDYSSNLFYLFLKTNLLALFFASIMLFMTAIAIGIWGYSKYQRFANTAEINIIELRETLEKGWTQEPMATNNYKNILLLGVDSLTGRGNVPPLTDTMMLLTINLKTGQVNTLPFPRDLWSEKYQTKINALYFYGQERFPNKPEQFTEETLEELTGVEIHHTLVVSLDKLEELIDTIGGVTIDIPVGFTDEEFPRPNIDVTIERDPKILYQTITFEPGKQTLSGEKALQYIRSRHSEGDEGTDISRGARQQLVIKALVTQLMNFDQYLKQPELAGELYKFYDENFASAFSLEEAVSTAKKLLPVRDQIELQNHQFSTTKEDPTNGLLDNPRPSYLYQNQWVYTIKNEANFKLAVQEMLFQ
ncbi:MAG: LCP family protein [Candidatus Pacebacteria bacterium]|nr:LCP family protein [Candidatus Paceibacterota bacterium]